MRRAVRLRQTVQKDVTAVRIEVGQRAQKERFADARRPADRHALACKNGQRQRSARGRVDVFTAKAWDRHGEALDLQQVRTPQLTQFRHDEPHVLRALQWLLNREFEIHTANSAQEGLRILEKIEAVDYDVFRRRPQLRFFDWPLLAWRAV